MPTSTVEFPSEESVRPGPIVHARLPHLPFRRISLPTGSSLMNRQSVVSVASFDSLPEDGTPALGSPGRASAVPAVMRNVNNIGRRKGRPTPVEKRGNRSREVKIKVDEARESKRRKVIHEFYETEKAYVNGLELIYSHFLTPIIVSLDTSQPLLGRAELTSVFSSFIDIWNLHRSFFSSLTILLTTTSPGSFLRTLHASPPQLSAILLSHFPYLSLYTPFITSFHTAISSLTILLSPNTPNPAFASFIATQEADPRCGRLKLRDWLLTIVQRCPRYLLLLKDLISCTDTEDPEHVQLTAVYALVSKITLSLNASLQTHAQTLSLLALQRSTLNLPPPLQFIAPGRNLIKRGALLQLEHGEPHEREFLLFSDCLVWLERERQGGGMSGWTREWGWNGTNDNVKANVPARGGRGMVRTRSKSEAELSMLKSRLATSSSASTDPSSFSDFRAAKSSLPHFVKKPPLSNPRRKESVVGSPSSPSNRNPADERWLYKGKGELVDVEIVLVGSGAGDGDEEERRFEVLSPEGSFAVYAVTKQERDEWSAAIRQAKASLLVTLNITHPNSTLTSSSSTNHLRRSLQALPFPPSDERLGTVGSNDDGGFSHSPTKKGRTGGEGKERRGRVEHWVPPIWIPDAKTEGCMRCGRSFGWRRRRHHCRLCGRCVCAACSDRTFFISDLASKESTKPARACEACYEAVFPRLDPPKDPDFSLARTNTITAFTGFPSWLSMPSLPMSTTPEALMAIDYEPPRERGLHRIDDSDEGGGDERQGGRIIEGGAGRRMRMKSSSRPRSYHQILEDFEDRERTDDLDRDSPIEGKYAGFDANRSSLVDGGPESHTADVSSSPRKEDTARRNKRFSMPAIALQTTSVMARTGGDRDGGGKATRFSLVLGSRGGENEMIRSNGMGTADEEGRGWGSELAKGVTAVKLSELLGRKRED